VFDSRVTVDHDLNKGSYDRCYGCRRPITEADKLDPKYKKGVSCHHCFDSLTAEQIVSFEEREKQNKMAEKNGELHIGQDAKIWFKKNKKKEASQKDENLEKRN